jgi:hypothetical protein
MSEVGWRVVVKLLERRGGKERWMFMAYPPGVAGQRGKLISSFEVSAKARKGEFGLELIGCMERLLNKLVPGGERTGTVLDIEWGLE